MAGNVVEKPKTLTSANEGLWSLDRRSIKVRYSLPFASSKIFLQLRQMTLKRSIMRCLKGCQETDVTDEHKLHLQHGFLDIYREG